MNVFVVTYSNDMNCNTQVWVFNLLGNAIEFVESRPSFRIKKEIEGSKIIYEYSFQAYYDMKCTHRYKITKQEIQ